MLFTLPVLPYDFSALEPHIDTKTMEIHHGKHHGGYVAKLNAALENGEFADWDLEKLLKGIASLPDTVRTSVRNNGGGHANHTLFWQGLSPVKTNPSGPLAKAFDSQLGGFDKFAGQFEAAALGRFGSGWAWLAVTPDKKLEVYSTANQDSPLMENKTPILGLDVWEHAYYLKYQNRRPDYVKAFFNIINWDRAGRNYEEAMSK